VSVQPPYKPGQMTTGELSRARTDLERRIAQPLSDARKEVLSDELKAVLTEQESRQKTTGLVPTAWSEVS
jgi:hypothetical protein